MFFKKKESAGAVYKGDPLWTVVLSQLKTQALCLTPHFRDAARNSNLTSESVLGYQRFETFLSQIEDSYDLTNLLFLKKANRRSTGLAQIAEDVSENYARRFGTLSENRVLILVDERLPAVKSYPPVIMRIIDCLVRAGQRLGGENGGQLRLRESTSLRSTSGEFHVVLECLNFSFGIEIKRLNQSLTKFRLGNYAQCINDLGLDICAALHLASQVGATPEFKTESGNCILQIDLPFERSGEPLVVPVAAGVFYVSSQSATTVAQLQELAKFHRVEAIPVARPGEVPSDARLVFDATLPNSLAVLKQEEGNFPESTVFLVSQQETAAVRTIVGSKFQHFLTLPLASTRLIRVLFGKRSTANVPHSVISRPARPLRIVIVDDTETARIVMRDHLECQGHSVVEAFDGSEFINLVRRGEHFDLAFCDLNMVHVDGLTAVRMLRELEKESGKHLPVALMTAFQAAGAEDEVEKAGVDRVLIKPVTPSDMDKILKELF